jgi:hypothetical protein
MRITSLAFIALLAGYCLHASPCRAAQTTAPGPIKFNLTYAPAVGADLTSTRVGALIRAGGVDKQPLLSVVAPDHPGTTLMDQPQLYWYISNATELTVEVAMLEESSEERVYDFSMKGVAAGFHCLDLAKEGVHLDINKRYQLVVAIILNPSNRAKDLVTSGFVKRVKASDELTKGVSKAEGMERASMLLSSGIWYDGIADLMQQIEAHKADPILVAARDSLLKQVGLGELASVTSNGGAQTRP